MPSVINIPGATITITTSIPTHAYAGRASTHHGTSAAASHTPMPAHTRPAPAPAVPASVRPMPHAVAPMHLGRACICVACDGPRMHLASASRFDLPYRGASRSPFQPSQSPTRQPAASPPTHTHASPHASPPRATPTPLPTTDAPAPASRLSILHHGASRPPPRPSLPHVCIWGAHAFALHVMAHACIWGTHAFALHVMACKSARACPQPPSVCPARSVCMHLRCACIRNMHASGSARSLARGISRYVPHTRFFLCGYCLASLLARGGRGAGHASAPSRKSPTELEDHAGGPAANAEG